VKRYPWLAVTLASMSLVLLMVAAWSAPPAGAAPRRSVLLLSSNDSTLELDPVTGQVGPQIANGADGVFAPNRTRVVYTQDTNPCAIIVFGFCFETRDLLIADSTGAGERALVETDSSNQFSPDWSPDGSRILYSFANPPGDGQGLAWIRPDGSGPETLQLGGWFGKFSPDGKRVAYMDLFSSEIHVMNVTTRASTPLTTGGTTNINSAPDWSPDGKRIAYTNSQGVNVVDARTGVSVSLTESSTAGLSDFRNPVFSPDGNQIAFAALDPSALPEGEVVPHIYVVSALGGQPRSIADQSGYPTDWIRL
jgi:TolB protein